MRADARRNRERILAVVADAFAAEGLEVPLDDLAKRAGVGPGTLYRHFPTKASLYEAVVDHRLRQVCAEAEALAGAPDAGSALREFLGRLADEITPKQDLVDALARVDIDVGATLAATGADLRAAIDVLLRRAQAAGAVRRDVTLDDLMGLLGGLLIAARGRRAADPKRMLSVVWDGLTILTTLTTRGACAVQPARSAWPRSVANAWFVLAFPSGQCRTRDTLARGAGA